MRWPLFSALTVEPARTTAHHAPQQSNQVRGEFHRSQPNPRRHIFSCAKDQNAVGYLAHGEITPAFLFESEELIEMRKRPAVLSFLAVTLFALGQPMAQAQSANGAGTSTQSQTQSNTPPAQTAPPAASSSSVQVISTYHRPSAREKFRSYAFDSFGPYAFAGSAVAGAVMQAESPSKLQSGSPPDWGQGWDSYGVRVASNFGINLITQSSRYTMGTIFREDTIYYRCECSGFTHRLEHALISTVTARKGEDGHRVFSFPALSAPYAGTEAAALLWYPNRFDAMDGFRMGNYNLALQAAYNVALEFVWGGPHTFLGRHHVPIVSSAAGMGPKN
jgi:hypothetical protein